MASAIDPSKPQQGLAPSKFDLRTNLSAAKREIEHGGFFEQTGLGAVERKTQDRLREAVLSPMDFGAVWDGESHPLSERYGTLAQAQQDYPHAQSLDDEIDWAALQACINAAVVAKGEYGANFGATILLPRGTGIMRRSIIYPSSNRFTNNPQLPLVMRGHGRRGSMLWWQHNDASLITQGHAMLPLDATVTNGVVTWAGDHNSEHADALFSDFGLRGPGHSYDFPEPNNETEFIEKYGFTPAGDWSSSYNTDNPSVGQLYESYSGLSCGAWTFLYHIQVAGFFAGINWRGGQKIAEHVWTENCYYGVYQTYSPGAHGDFTMRKCNFTGRMAAIALAPAAGWYGAMDTCFMGGAPYGIYKEGTDPATSDADAAAAAGPHYGDFFTGPMTHCQWESIGNAMIAEGNPVGSKRHQIRNLTLGNCIFREWSTNYRFPASDVGYRGAIVRAALIDVKEAKSLKILNPHDPDHWLPRNECIFKWQIAPTEVTIEGIDLFIDAASSENKPVFAYHGPFDYGAILLRGSSWIGTTMRVSSGQSLAKFDVVGQRNDFAAVKPYLASDCLAIMGVAQEANPDTSGEQMLCIATEYIGVGLINVEGGETPSPAQCYLEPSTNEPGKVVARADKTATVIGIGMRAGVGRTFGVVFRQPT